MAGLDGVKNSLRPCPPINANIFELTEEDKAKYSIDNLPTNLYEAIQEMQKDELVVNTLGPHIMDRYIDAKLKEWKGYMTAVDTWELKEYLTIF